MLRKPRLALVRECIPNAKRVTLMRHLANPALNLQVEASNAAAPELAGVVVLHTASFKCTRLKTKSLVWFWHGPTVRAAAVGDVRCYGASGDDIASIGGLLTERWLHRRRC